jgi:hypothetical protein
MRGSFLFPGRGKENMAKVVVYLRENELQALNDLAQKEYRAPRAQAALILRIELERLGMLATTPQPADKEARHDD